jgi:plasmid maintenance system antidote protein VapI
MPKIDPNAIAQAGGVTAAYARMLLAGSRTPSLPLAIKLYDAIGLQLGPLANLDRRSIDVARQMAPQAERAA